MKRINKIIAVIMSITVMITAVSAVTVDAYAASKPSATSITSVSAKSSSIKIKWKKKSCTGYQIQYSTSSKFKSAKTVKVTKAKTVSKTISKLKSSKKYYVRVRTYKKSGKKTKYSSWSKAKSVTTKKASSNSSSELTVTSNPTSTYRVNKITINWKKQNVDGYEVEYDVSNKFNTRDDDFHNAFEIKATSKDGKNATKSFNFDNYENADKLYVRVRSYQKYYDKKFKMYLYKYSSWSKVATVKLTKCVDDAIIALDKAYAQMNITSDMSDLQKIAQIQKWIDANWHYTNSTNISDKNTNVCFCDSEDTDNGDVILNDYSVGNWAHSLIQEKHGGCQSFAYAFRYFANKAGISCEVLVGDANYTNPGHYWNYIKVNECWYEYDCEGTYADGYRPDYRFVSRVGSSYTLRDNSLKVYNSNQPCASSYEARQLSKTFAALMNY